MMRCIITGVLALVLGVVLMFGYTNAANILFMHQENSPDFDDQFVEYIESLGHTVEVYDTSANDALEQIELAEAADVVYVTESLSSTTTFTGTETNIKEVETPQIWAEAYA